MSDTSSSDRERQEHFLAWIPSALGPVASYLSLIATIIETPQSLAQREEACLYRLQQLLQLPASQSTLSGAQALVVQSREIVDQQGKIADSQTGLLAATAVLTQINTGMTKLQRLVDQFESRLYSPGLYPRTDFKQAFADREGDFDAILADVERMLDRPGCFEDAPLGREDITSIATRFGNTEHLARARKLYRYLLNWLPLLQSTIMATFSPTNFVSQLMLADILRQAVLPPNEPLAKLPLDQVLICCEGHVDLHHPLGHACHNEVGRSFLPEEGVSDDEVKTMRRSYEELRFLSQVLLRVLALVHLIAGCDVLPPYNGHARRKDTYTFLPLGWLIEQETS